MKLGMELPGDYHDAHEKMLSFDPQNIHTTEPFKGTRYAITYYTLTRWQELEPTSQKILNDFGFQLPSTQSEVSPKDVMDLPHSTHTIALEGEPAHARFKNDTSSDSSEESADEELLFRGQVLKDVEQERPDLEAPLKVEQQVPGTTDLINGDSDDSEVTDNEEQKHMTQDEYEEVTGQLDFDYSVNAVVCPTQLHQQLKSAIETCGTLWMLNIRLMR